MICENCADEGIATIETFVADIIRRSKDVETLIAALPKKDDSSQRVCLLQPTSKALVWNVMVSDPV